MADIIQFPGTTTADIPADTVLDAAKGQLKSAIILGYTKDDRVYFASGLGDAAENMWLLELFKHALLTGFAGYDEEDE